MSSEKPIKDKPKTYYQFKIEQEKKRLKGKFCASCKTSFNIEKDRCAECYGIIDKPNFMPERIYTFGHKCKKGDYEKFLERNAPEK